MHVDEAIATRRTHKVYDGTPVPRATVEALIQAALWAPNHRFTEPWRFVAATGDTLVPLGEAACAALDSMRKAPGVADAKIDTKQRKFRQRMKECGAVVIVTYVATPDNPAMDREDYAATACGVQNMQLAATARGLVCLWSTSAVFSHPIVRAHLGIPPGQELVACLFIGKPVTELRGRRHKPLGEVTRWLEDAHVRV